MRCSATCLGMFCLVLCCFFTSRLPAQTAPPHHPSCRFDHHNEQLLDRFPALRQELEHYRQRVLPGIQQPVAESRNTTTLYVPVVVHVIHNGEAEGNGANLSDARIQAQIDVMNEDFSATNANYALTPGPLGGGSRQSQYPVLPGHDRSARPSQRGHCQNPDDGHRHRLRQYQYRIGDQTGGRLAGRPLLQYIRARHPPERLPGEG